MAKNRRLISMNDASYVRKQAQAKAEQYDAVSAAEVMPSLQGAAISNHSARIAASETRIKSKKWASPVHQADEQMNEFGQYLIPYFENLNPDWLPTLRSPYYDERERAAEFAQDRYRLQELYRVARELSDQYASLRAELHDAAISYADKLVEEYRLQQISLRRKLVEEAWIPIVPTENAESSDAQTGKAVDAVSVKASSMDHDSDEDTASD